MQTPNAKGRAQGRSRQGPVVDRDPERGKCLAETVADRQIQKVVAVRGRADPQALHELVGIDSVERILSERQVHHRTQNSQYHAVAGTPRVSTISRHYFSRHYFAPRDGGSEAPGGTLQNRDSCAFME